MTGVVVPGNVERFLRFEVADKSLTDLREVIASARADNAGVLLVGDVGLLCHFGDMLRREGIASRVERSS